MKVNEDGCMPTCGKNISLAVYMAKEPLKFKECPVCSGCQLRPFRKGTFDFLSLNKDKIRITDSDYGKIWNLTLCETCCHVFADPCPSPELIHSLYSKIEDPLYEEEAKGRGKNFLRILSYLEKIHPKKGNILDVGAATGILLNLARQRGWKTAGVEASKWAARFAREKYNLNIQEGSFESARLKKSQYTAVTMVDFIEHVPHPFEAVTKAFKVLSHEGTLCIVTPDIGSVAAKIMNGKWWHFRPAHLGYFSKESLVFLLQRAGFRIIKLRKYSWTFSAYYLISRKSRLKFLINNSDLASLWKRIPIKLALCDSLEIYARKGSKE